MLHNHRQDRLLQAPGCAEIAADQPSQPCQVLHDRWFVQAQLGAQRRNGLRRAVGGDAEIEVDGVPAHQREQQEEQDS
jgi:hypothetical protein